MSKRKSETKEEAPPLKNFGDDIFQKRLSERYEEIYSLYSTIYHDNKMFESLIDMIYDLYKSRSAKLKKLDDERLKEPNWCYRNDSITMQLYVEKYAKNLRGIETKLDYLQKLGIKFVYALPFLRSPPEKSDGGFACSDYRNVREDLGTIEDLEHLIDVLHDRGMCFIMDFVINHSSDEHEWAKRAKNNEIEYQNRYYFYDSWYIPNQFDSYGVMGHFFGDIAPDNFTFVPECQKIVMTTFYPYQWDLNYRNPIVFNQMLNNILYMMNRGVDIIVFNGASNLWKKAGTSCQNLPQAYIINQIINLAMEIVCPGTAVSFDIKRHKNRELNNDEIKNIRLSKNTIKNSLKKEDNIIEHQNEENEYDDESESENENDFVITESGVIKSDAAADINLKNYYNYEEEENEEVDFDLSTEIGRIHHNSGWMARLWGSLAFGNVHSISYSINAISNRFAGDGYLTNVHTHDDINWGFGFDVENNSLIGNGKGVSDGFQGGIISLYRYLNDFYSGNMPGSFSKGVMFAEDLVTGKARICGTTASLLGLESSIQMRDNIQSKIDKCKLKNKPIKKSLIQKLGIAENGVHLSICRILLLHAVTGAMPSMFIIYYGDEIGKLNDYSYKDDPSISQDTRYLQRGSFNWDSINLIDSDENSYQSRIFNGIKNIINARLKCPYFTDCKKTVFLKSYSINEYFDDIKKDQNTVNFSNREFERDNTLLIFKRFRDDVKFILFVFNFCNCKRPVHIDKNYATGKFREMITGKIFDQINDIHIDPYGYLWFEQIDEC